MTTDIEWADDTLNPQAGCTRRGEPCRHCYAQIMAWRLDNMNRRLYEGVAKKTTDGWNWTGKINFDASILSKATKRKKPTIWFVNSMSDLWHEKVPLSRIETCFNVFANCPQHVFQVLTKRAERLGTEGLDIDWPDNVWQGVSVGDRNALPYIEHLRNSTAKVKFISAEPLIEDLGQIDLSGIDWVIIGGESGFSPRPMEEAWAISLLDQCIAQDVKVFFKQWGGPHSQPKRTHSIEGGYWLQFPTDHPAVLRKREDLARKCPDQPITR